VSRAVLLGQFVGRCRLLDVAGDRCERPGRLSVARLIDEHGAALPLSTLVRIGAADYPRLATSTAVQGPRRPGRFCLTARSIRTPRGGKWPQAVRPLWGNRSGGADFHLVHRH
jgi:hypothetical protein